MPEVPVSFDISIADPVARINEFIDRYHKYPDYDGFEGPLMRNIKVISARSTRDEGHEGELAQCEFQFEVLPAFCSPTGNIHGGAVALLADMTTSMATAPISRDGWWEFGGVSRTLNVTFLSPFPVGITVRVECVLRSIGKRLSVTQCNMRDLKDNRLLAMAEHGKSALAPQNPGGTQSTQLANKI